MGPLSGGEGEFFCDIDPDGRVSFRSPGGRIRFRPAFEPVLAHYRLGDARGAVVDADYTGTDRRGVVIPIEVMDCDRALDGTFWNHQIITIN